MRPGSAGSTPSASRLSAAAADCCWSRSAPLFIASRSSFSFSTARVCAAVAACVIAALSASGLWNASAAAAARSDASVRSSDGLIIVGIDESQPPHDDDDAFGLACCCCLACSSCCKRFWRCSSNSRRATSSADSSAAGAERSASRRKLRKMALRVHRSRRMGCHQSWLRRLH